MKNLKIKLIVTILSIMLFAIDIVLYCTDNSMDWNIEKITSFIFISIWICSIPQMLTYYFFKIKNSKIKYSVSLGYEVGIRRFLGFIFAPFYGIKFYIVDLNDLKYNGEFFFKILKKQNY
ncbi:hypothetical protein [Haploplasma axanthum]|uniref:RDD domain-containing protein n=1 Tax=Haploplasma axanthum TaxID=29552 RepID=A0A449BEI7_HAPAX|nr:hypothetical protein [Haploplasma axanthum]VEU80847.1 Uncharacterised protein [Haploplasma axanthum]